MSKAKRLFFRKTFGEDFWWPTDSPRTLTVLSVLNVFGKYDFGVSAREAVFAWFFGDRCCYCFPNIRTKTSKKRKPAGGNYAQGVKSSPVANGRRRRRSGGGGGHYT